MERRIEEINRFTVGWTAYFGLADTPCAVRGSRRVAQTPTTAGPLEGMEAPPHTATQPASAGYPRGERPQMGVLAQGILAHRRLLSPLPSPCPTPTGPTTACKGFADPYRRFRECRANRRMRTRTSGGVGGAGVSRKDLILSASRLGIVTAFEAIVRQDDRRPSNAATRGGRPLLLPDAWSDHACAVAALTDQQQRRRSLLRWYLWAECDRPPLRVDECVRVALRSSRRERR